MSARHPAQRDALGREIIHGHHRKQDRRAKRLYSFRRVAAEAGPSISTHSLTAKAEYTGFTASPTTEGGRMGARGDGND
jgi:hypothetical protein